MKEIKRRTKDGYYNNYSLLDQTNEPMLGNILHFTN